MLKKCTKAMMTILICACFCLSVKAEEGVYKTGYVCFDPEKKIRWTATTKIFRPKDEKRPNIYILTEEVEGRYYGYKDEISWFAELIFESTDKTVRPLEMKTTVFNKEGKKIAREVQKFDYTKEKVYYIYENLIKKRKKKRVFRFKGNVVNRLILGLYVQKFLENGKTEELVYMLNREPRMYKINIKVMDKEKLNINGREKLAYKIKLDPHLGILNLIKLMLPESITWHSASPDYEWLKYSGVESTAASPSVEIITLE